MGPAWVLYGSDNDDDDNGDDDGDDDGLVLAGGTLLQRSNSSCNSNQLLEAWLGILSTSTATYL